MTSINTNKEKLPFLNVGNSIEITYANETEVIKILKVKQVYYEEIYKRK